MIDFYLRPELNKIEIKVIISAVTRHVPQVHPHMALSVGSPEKALEIQKCILCKNGKKLND